MEPVADSFRQHPYIALEPGGMLDDLALIDLPEFDQGEPR
jgi:hypothetical protein